MGGTMRSFISIAVPELPAVARAVRELRARGERAGDPARLHLTLRFAGDVPDSKVPAMCGSVERALSGIGPFDIALRGMGAFPDPRRPRVIWIGADGGPDLLRAAEAAAAALDAAGVEYDGKPFSPHITICRPRGGGLSDFIAEHAEAEFGTFRCGRIDVMKSELTSRGAVHSALRRVPLG